MYGKAAVAVALSCLLIIVLCTIGERNQRISEWDPRYANATLKKDSALTKDSVSPWAKKCPLNNSDTQNFGSHLRCSTTLFRKYNSECGYFPTGGAWVTVSYHGESVTKFQPSACHFQWPDTEKLRRSLSSVKGTHLLLVGSSQMRNYRTGMIAALQNVGYNCALIQKEQQVDRTPDVSYFSQKDTDVRAKLQVRPHHCSGCLSSLHICSAPWGDINVEYIGMDDILDSTVRFYNRYNREKSIETFQEFMFRQFLKDRYPNVLVISPTLNHVKFKDTAAKFALDLDYLRGLMHLYLPETTRVFWIPGVAESEKTRHSEQYLRKRVDGWLASDKINHLNHVLYAQTEHELLNVSSSVYGFLDLYQASLDRGDWYGDGVHLQPIWYRTMAAYILELIYLIQ